MTFRTPLQPPGPRNDYDWNSRPNPGTDFHAICLNCGKKRGVHHGTHGGCPPLQYVPEGKYTSFFYPKD